MCLTLDWGLVTGLWILVYKLGNTQVLTLLLAGLHKASLYQRKRLKSPGDVSPTLSCVRSSIPPSSSSGPGYWNWVHSVWSSQTSCLCHHVWVQGSQIKTSDLIAPNAIYLVPLFLELFGPCPLFSQILINTLPTLTYLQNLLFWTLAALPLKSIRIFISRFFCSWTFLA